MPRGICRAWQAGECRYGEACKFRHAADGVDETYTHANESCQRKAVKHVAFISGLPICIRADVARRAVLSVLQACLWSRAPVLRVGTTHENHSRGWAHVTCRNEADLARCISALDGATLEFSGTGTSVLSASPVTDKRDTLFPHVTYEQRVQLQLDSTAVFSVTDGDTAQRTADVIAHLFSLATTRANPAGCHVVDVCACAGGSALAFAAHPDVTHITAVELDPVRARHVEHNARVCGLSDDRIRAVCGDGTHADVLTRDGTRPCDVVFCDPPWGGPQYSAAAAIPVDCISLGDMTMPDLAHRWLHDDLVPLVALGMPLNYDDTALVRHLTACRPGDEAAADRVLPFRLVFGRRVLLIFLAPAWRSSGPNFPTSGLDTYVAALRAWNTRHGEEHHPRFYDWEKDVWVPLSRWKGTKPVKRTGGGLVPE